MLLLVVSTPYMLAVQFTLHWYSMHTRALEMPSFSSSVCSESSGGSEKNGSIALAGKHRRHASLTPCRHYRRQETQKLRNSCSLLTIAFCMSRASHLDYHPVRRKHRQTPGRSSTQRIWYPSRLLVKLLLLLERHFTSTCCPNRGNKLSGSNQNHRNYIKYTLTAFLSSGAFGILQPVLGRTALGLSQSHDSRQRLHAGSSATSCSFCRKVPK